MPPHLSPTPLELSRHRELSGKVELLHGTRAAVRRMKAKVKALGQRRSLPLPLELMGMIFDFYVHSYRQLPETLLLVCRTWHVLALSQPTLWTNLDPLGQFGQSIVRPWAGTFIQSRVARSNPAPLKVDFTRLSLDLTPRIVKKIAAIPTFRTRIQELVIGRDVDMNYLVGHQPMLTSLTVVGSSPPPLQKILSRPAKFKLAEKKLIALRLHTLPKPPAWPDVLLQRLQTLEVSLTSDPATYHEYWSVIQKATSLHSLHVITGYASASTLFHPSVQHLSISYLLCHSLAPHSLEVRMPRLHDLTITIDFICSIPLLKLRLVDTPTLSLRLTCKHDVLLVPSAVVVPWVESVVHFLHSTTRLESMEISAPPDLVSGLLEAFELDSGLCAGLNAFIVKEPMVKYGGKNMEGILDRLRGKAAAFIETRQSGISTQ